MGKRKNGEGTVRLRSDGRWEGRYIVGYRDNGTAITKNVLAKSRQGELVSRIDQWENSYEKYQQHVFQIGKNPRHTSLAQLRSSDLMKEILDQTKRAEESADPPTE